MAPKSLAVLIGAGPTSGAGVARMLAHPSHGNRAVALLARNPDNLAKVTDSVRASLPAGCVLHSFPTDTEPANLSSAFRAIAAHPEFQGLKLDVAIWHVKHSSKKPFLDETPAGYGESLQTYATGAFAFAQEALKLMYAHHGGETTLAETNGAKKGTIIFTGTLGALRTNAEYAAYGSGRASVRMLAQTVAREHSAKGIHAVHSIANGGIRDEDSPETRSGVRMSAEAVGRTYVWLAEQEPTLWVHELDLRPAQEKF